MSQAASLAQPAKIGPRGAACSQPWTPPRPWLASYPPGVPHQIDVWESVALLLREALQNYARLPAFESFGSRISYARLERSADRVASWLRGQGVTPGTPVAIMMPNVMAHPVVLLGALLGGYPVVEVNPLYTAREVVHQIADAGARVLFVLEQFSAAAAAALVDLPDLQRVVVCQPGDLIGARGIAMNLVARRRAGRPTPIPGAHRLKSVLATPDDGRRETPGPDDIALIQYTGGTTGVAKGAVLTQRNLAANALQCEAWFKPAIEAGGRPPVMLAAMPLYHIFALTGCFIQTLHLGATGLLVANPRDIDSLVQALRRTPPTMMLGVNTLYAALLDHLGFGRVDLSQLAFAISGGMAVQSDIARRWEVRVGRPLTAGYGLTETSCVVTIGRLDQPWDGTVGLPSPSTEVRIAPADEDSDHSSDSVGELLVRGPQVTPGYWRRQEETAQALTADGWFRTGDLARLHADGRIEIVDRLKDMILVSGFNVYPNEVEDVLAGHAQVREVAVVGEPDDRSGETVVAHVVASSPELTEDALRAWVRDKLAAYKVPKRIVLHTELPKSAVGKILRRKLRAPAASTATEPLTSYHKEL